MFSNMHLTEVSQPINEESGVLKHFKITGIFLHYIPNLNIALLINLNCKEIIAVLDVTLITISAYYTLSSSHNCNI